MTFIVIGTIIVYLLVIAWSWNSLEDMEKTKKILIIFIGFLIVYVLTEIVFGISKGSITYENEDIEKSIRQTDDFVDNMIKNRNDFQIRMKEWKHE